MRDRHDVFRCNWLLVEELMLRFTRLQSTFLYRAILPDKYGETTGGVILYSICNGMVSL